MTISDGTRTKTVCFNGEDQVYYIGTEDMAEVSLLVNGTGEGDNLYINNRRVASGESVRIEVPQDGGRLVRLIVQNGDSEPFLCVLKLMQGKTEEELQKEAIRDIYRQTGAALNNAAQTNAPQVGSVGGEWMVLGLARSGFEIPEAYYQNVAAYVSEHINEKEQLSPRLSTDNSRVILALTAAGYDVTDVGGHDLLKGLSDLTFLKKQGINGPIWALLALDSHAY